MAARVAVEMGDPAQGPVWGARLLGARGRFGFTRRLHESESSLITALAAPSLPKPSHFKGRRPLGREGRFLGVLLASPSRSGSCRGFSPRRGWAEGRSPGSPRLPQPQPRSGHSLVGSDPCRAPQTSDPGWVGELQPRGMGGRSPHTLSWCFQALSSLGPQWPPPSSPPYAQPPEALLSGVRTSPPARGSSELRSGLSWLQRPPRTVPHPGCPQDTQSWHLQDHTATLSCAGCYPRPVPRGRGEQGARDRLVRAQGPESEEGPGMRRGGARGPRPGIKAGGAGGSLEGKPVCPGGSVGRARTVTSPRAAGQPPTAHAASWFPRGRREWVRVLGPG